MAGKKCTIEGCDRDLLAQGRCGLHYRRARESGEISVIKRSNEELFWEKVNLFGPGGCWLWLASLSRGYGQISYRRYRTTSAHRYAYTLLVGRIPEGLHLDHLCRVTACVNPAHLEPVTPAENNRRSTSISANNALKTHCKHGHEFTPENTRIRPKGQRECRACHRDQCRARRERLRAAVA